MRISCGIAVLASLAACASRSNDDRGLAMARAQWSSHQLTAYRFTWQESCFCSPDEVRAMRVVVANGQVAGVVFADDGTAVADTDSHNVKTVDELFDHLAMEVSGGSRLDVAFDPVLSYPTSASVRGDGQIPDYGFTIQITNLTVAP